jgi:hypothetical protein
VQKKKSKKSRRRHVLSQQAITASRSSEHLTFIYDSEPPLALFCICDVNSDCHERCVVVVFSSSQCNIPFLNKAFMRSPRFGPRIHRALPAVQVSTMPAKVVRESDGTVSISWEPTQGAPSYRVEYTSENNGPYNMQLIADPEIKISNLNPSLKYNVTISALTDGAIYKEIGSTLIQPHAEVTTTDWPG